MGKLPKVPQDWLEGAVAPQQGASSTGQAQSPSNSIDWDFVLGKSEGALSTKGYIPRVDDTSGLTVGHGVDLGSVSSGDLQKWGASPELAGSLSPYLGKKGAEARAFLTDPNDRMSGPLKMSEADAELLTNGARNRSVGELANAYQSATGKNFHDLSPAQQTVLADINYQTGPTGIRRSFAHGQFWNSVVNDDWHGARNVLQTMKSQFQGRRDREAALLKDY
jgi:hypothetical protein